MINNIRMERLKAGLTQEVLADRLNVSRQTINALEKNKYCPSTILALKLSNLFGIPVNDIFKLEDSDYWFFLPVNRIKSSPSSCETRPFSIIMLEGIERLKEVYGYLPNPKRFSSFDSSNSGLFDRLHPPKRSIILNCPVISDTCYGWNPGCPTTTDNWGWTVNLTSFAAFPVRLGTKCPILTTFGLKSVR